MPKPSQPDLAGYLRRKGSPLADHVPDLIRSAHRYRVDPRLLVAISGGETSFATNGRGPSQYNAWGIGPGKSYDSWAHGIDAAAKLLRTGYLDKGLTSLPAIQRKWAPVGAGNDPSNLNSNWLRTNGQFYSDLGGNPNDVRGGWRNFAAPKNLGPVPVKTPSGVPLAPYSSMQDLGVQQALSNLRSISRGDDPSKTLSALVEASIQQTITEAAAQRNFDQPPAPEKNRSPDGGTYVYTRTGEKVRLPRSATRFSWRSSRSASRTSGSAGPKSFDCSG
jgi:hypothetical protein